MSHWIPNWSIWYKLTYNTIMGVLQEGKQSIEYDYTKINQIITEILCSKGSCPVF